ncbi:hypothetical protein NEMBOFW57_009138 [Staphylotrichum longicolle]|uniref:Uncharacterized protein n=1 Tax=Staphylotrichum longicolle TaxID=669026 RepID=A0AAD4ESZ4_9PEZI|nr:hypothetical protein NEMBOFW57_009138 [Staphylotrichum longicolle]
MTPLPTTTEDILATGIMDPEFEVAWKARGSPPGDMPADMRPLKRLMDASLPGLQSKLAASLTPFPIILLFHGGIHPGASPSPQRHVVCASPARKAPEHPFPAMLHDAWAILQALAHDAAAAAPKRSFLPATRTPARGL